MTVPMSVKDTVRPELQACPRFLAGCPSWLEGPYSMKEIYSSSMVNTFHVECLQDTQKMMYTDNQNVYLGPRRKAWSGEADLRTVCTRGFET